MLDAFIPLVASFFSADYTLWFFVPVFSLAVIATIPCIIRELVSFR